jgi:hypothetical protein
MGEPPMRDKPPLDYRSKPTRKSGPLWLVFFAAIAYGVGAFLCYGHTFGEMFGIMEIVTVIVIGISAVFAGVHYGTQDKDFWA